MSPSIPRPVVWTEPALEDLAAIRSYIFALNPSAAQRIAVALVEAADSLSTYPLRGRSSGGSRRLTIVVSYVIRYQVRADQVVILRVRHGMRRRV